MKLVLFICSILFLTAKATKIHKKIKPTAPKEESTINKPATIESKMENVFTTQTVTCADEETQTIVKIIKNGSVDELDDAVEALGGYADIFKTNASLLHYAAHYQRLDAFIHLLDKGFSVDSTIPGLNMPIYRFIITMKSTPVRDAMLRIAYETSDMMLEDYYRPMFKKTGWDVDAAEAMKLNDFIYIDRILNRHKAHPHNVITNQGLMLHSAILNDCPECVRLILKAGADPNYRYVGTALMRSCAVGINGKSVEHWTPLMMAVANGNIRVIDALLESSSIRVCSSLPGNETQTARQLVRELPKSPEKFELLRKLHARPADAPILEGWIKGISLAHLDMKFALHKANRKFLEFLLHNCVQEIKPEWLEFAVKHSSVECLKILLDEFPNPSTISDLKRFLKADDKEYAQKENLIKKVQSK